MTIASKLETINSALSDIKTAIVAKGVTPTGDITTFSTAIDSISGGMDTVEATNYTENAISIGDKVWINQEGNRLYNFTTIGSPTIDVQTYNVSNFNTTSYITLDKILSFESTDSWEDVVCFTTGSDISTTQCVYCSNVAYWGLGAEIKNNKLNIGASRKGSSFDIFLTETSAPYTVDANTKYYIKISYTNGLYTISIAGSDGIYTVLTTISSSLQPLVGIRRYGVNDSASYPFYGVLHLSESYIKINNSFYWKPLITEPNSYIIQDYNIIQQNVTPFGSAKVKDGIVYELASSSGATSTTNNFAVTSSTPWEYVVCCKSNGDFGSNYGNYISACGGYIQGPYINIEENGNILTHFTNGSSWLGSLIAYSGNARTLNQKIWIKTTYDGNGNYASYSSLDGENWTAGESASYSGINITRPLQFGYSSSGTYFRGIIYLDECYIKINGVETWRGYVKTDKINAPYTALTGTAAENIAIGGTGDVEIGDIIEPTISRLEITPSTSSQTFDSNSVDGYKPVIVSGVTSSIDANIIPENIKKDITILGVIGTHEGGGSTINNQNKTVSAETSQKYVTFDSGYTGLGTVTINAVDSSIDNNIISGNIIEGKSILGVPGSAKAGANGYNFKVVGSSPIITQNGIASGFSGTDKLIQFETPKENISSLEMVIKFTLPSQMADGTGYICVKGFQSLRVVKDGSSVMLYGGQVGYISTSINVTLGETYWVKVIYNGTSFTASYSTNGISWTQYWTSGVTDLYTKPFIFGNEVSDTIEAPFTGQIDLSETYIKVNDKMWWTWKTMSYPMDIDLDGYYEVDPSYTGFSHINVHVLDAATEMLQEINSGSGTISLDESE